MERNVWVFCFLLKTETHIREFDPFVAGKHSLITQMLALCGDRKRSMSCSRFCVATSTARLSVQSSRRHCVWVYYYYNYLVDWPGISWWSPFVPCWHCRVLAGAAARPSPCRAGAPPAPLSSLYRSPATSKKKLDML